MCTRRGRNAQVTFQPLSRLGLQGTPLEGKNVNISLDVCTFLDPRAPLKTYFYQKTISFSLPIENRKVNEKHRDLKNVNISLDVCTFLTFEGSSNYNTSNQGSENSSNEITQILQKPW